VAAIGDVISGKYKLIRLLGDGGMGSVYEASHEMLGTRVAIKILHAELLRRSGLIDRFLQEARVAAQIKSVHVVRVTDVDRTPEGLAYIVMELLEGEALSAALDRQAKVPIATACDFVSQILDALEAAHALGVTHRDLKPENVFITYQGAKPVLKLIDFGIAKLKTNVPGERSLTVAGMLMGTAEYMAPEQAYSADKVDGRSDVYAVGVMLYEMIAGKRPVQGQDARIIAAKVERGEVVPLVHVVPDVPREIAGLVHRAMAPRPELRFASATEMRLALEAAIAGKQFAAGGAPAAVKNATVQSAPVQAAFGAPDRSHATHASDAPPRTERAPGPIAVAFAPPPGAQAPSAVTPPPMNPRTGGRRKGRGGLWAMILIPLFVGAGAVATWVVTTQGAPSPSPIATAPASPPTWTAPTVATATGPVAPTTLPSITPLLPSPGAPQGQNPSSPRAPGAPRSPHAPGSASAAASGAPDVPYTPPPFTIPSGFGFPTSNDGGATLLPFPIPSAFPTAFPSAFPFPFPGQPQAPAEPAPTPSGAKSM
jgi:serine/threonine protein kinase